MTITDWQFELGGVEFGVGQDVAVSKFERGGVETRDQDQPAGWGDWVNFGRDRKTPGLWTWEMSIDLRTAEEARAALDRLETVWDAEEIRDTPGAAMPLRYLLPGAAARRVYGRPRRFTATPDVLLTSGRVDIVADFQLMEAAYYSDVELSETLSIGAVGAPRSGLRFPVVFPTLWGGVSTSPRTRNISVGGRRRTWVRAEVNGPITDPYVIINGVVLQMRGFLASGMTVVLASAPWERGVYLTDGSEAPVALDVTAELSSLRLAPGSYEVTFGGIDPTGSATCQAFWRERAGSM